MIAALLIMLGLGIALSIAAGPRTSRAVTIVVGVIVAAIAVAALAGEASIWTLDVSWIPALGARLSLGGDTISWSLVGVSGLLVAVAIGGTPSQSVAPRAFHALFATLLLGLTVTFLARDLLLFYFGFEIALVPMYFIIGNWGEADRWRAALTFFIYTRIGSLAMLLGIIGIALAPGAHGFANAAPAIPSPVAAGFIFAGLLLGFCIKLPVAPLHLWLPLAHVEAPTEGSVVLAGLLLKLGGYGLIRIALPHLAPVFAATAPCIVAWGALSALWGVLASFAQTDFKRLVAYTSVNHMGYVLVAIAVAAAAGPGSTIGKLAIAGAALQMVSHALLTGGLFLIVGWMQHRYGTRDVTRLRGLIAADPTAGWILVLLALGSLGIPGLSGFAAEVQILLATAAVYPIAAGAVALAIVLMTALLTWTLVRVAFGDPSDAITLADRRTVTPALPGSALGVLLAASALLGIVPRLLVDGFVAAARMLRLG